MKKTNLKIIALAAITLAFGCNKITDINVSPNNPPLAQGTPQILFPSAVASSAGRIGGELQILGGFWSQFYTQANTSQQYSNIDSYALTKNDLNANYNELFAGALQDYQLTIQQATAKNQWNYVLMATCMKAYTYQVLADLYDQVPYTQAFQGLANTQPAFDKGHDIYLGLFKEIESALIKNYTDLDAADQATDLLFAGDMKKWVEFAHTLELKMYLRMINSNAADAQAGVTRLFAHPDFLSEDAGVTQYVDAPAKDNPFYEYNIRALNTTTNIIPSITFLSFLNETNDPRTSAYLGNKPVGINQGDYTNSAYTGTTNPVQKPTDPVWFISAAESHFLQAEALQRYFGGAGAKAQYLAGIDASLAANKITSTTAAAFSSASTNQNLNFDLSADKLQTIMVQKWVSMAQGCHALEAFFDQERTGYPKISAVYSTAEDYISGQWVYSKNGVTPNKLFPKRLVFPASEEDRNKNAPAQVPLTTPVWWGLKTN